MNNRVTLAGRLTKGPKLKWTREVNAVTDVTLAVSRKGMSVNVRGKQILSLADFGGMQRRMYSNIAGKDP